MPFDILPDETHRALTALAQSVSSVRPVETKTFHFRTGALVPGTKPDALIEEVKAWAKTGERFVYFFYTDAKTAALATLYKAIAAAREAKHEERKYARLFVPSQALYVGGSSSLSTRFKEHLGYGNKSVYAMQLAFWANVRDIPVRFTAARYPQKTSNEVLGALEDQLWTQMRPMMGRRGRR